jgi:O-antigen ligase
MLVFAFIFCYETFITDKRKTRLLNYSMLILAVYCQFQSHTRTSYIGFVLFWAIFFFGTSKKYFYYLMIVVIAGSLIFSSQITSIFVKKEGEIDFNVATSGRVNLFRDYSEAFLDFSISEKFLGKGIGWTLPGKFGAHNDWLKLLYQTGIVGISLYISILISILYDIYLCKKKLFKQYYGAIVIAFSIMVLVAMS